MTLEDRLTSFQRFVLLALAELDAADETPAFSYEVKHRCERRLEALEEPFGQVTRCSVIRALNALEAAGFVEQRPADEREAEGMGRPVYSLVSPERVREAIAGDGLLSPLAIEEPGARSEQHVAPGKPTTPR
jgi:DNA-binding transcriptional ArsR family regulator